MPLVFQPTFSDKTRQEIEQHLLVVRAKRMLAVVTYYAGVNAKNMHLIAREQQRIAREYEMLKRDMDRMNKLEQAIETRLIKLEQHRQELGFHQGNLVNMENEDDREQSEQRSSRRSSQNGSGEGIRKQGTVRSGRPPGS